MNSTYAKPQFIILMFFLFGIINSFTASASFTEGQANVAKDNVVHAAYVPNSTDNTLHVGFLNGFKYGITYPLVFWRAEGFKKVPFEKMSASFGAGTFMGLVVLASVSFLIWRLNTPRSRRTGRTIDN